MNILLIGKKSTGKSATELSLTKYIFEKIISYTTRKIREGEVDGVDYHFIGAKEFDEKWLRGFFAEEVTRIDSSGNMLRYGISKKDLLNNKNNVMVVETQGLFQILKNIPREELLIVKLTCDIGEKINRIINRDKPQSYDEVIRLMNDMKADSETFDVDYPFDLEIDTTNKTLREVSDEIVVHDKIFYDTLTKLSKNNKED